MTLSEADLSKRVTPRKPIKNGIHLQSQPSDDSDFKLQESTSSVSSKKRILADKVFLERDSLLTQMFNVKEFKGLYNLFLVILINLSLYTIVSDYLEHGWIDLGFSSLTIAFERFWTATALVAAMHLSSLFILFPWFKIWTFGIGGNNLLNHIWFGIFLTIFTYLFLYIPIKIHADNPFPPASASIVVMEQVRLLMKNYAFLRTNVAVVVKMSGNIKDSKKQEKHARLNDKNSPDYLSGFSEYLYFLFAPTLVFRNVYPRTKSVNWKFVVQNLIELFGCVFVYNLIHQLCGFELLRNFGLLEYKFSKKQLLNIIFFQMIPGGLGYLLGFFILLHTLQNIFAELLRFGDRHFYKDWWNSDSFSSFYKNWNLPVQDFLYAYIYKEAKNAIPRSRIIPVLSVFLISALVHEYILMFVLQFFYPVLFVFFGGFGLLLNFFKNDFGGSGNIFIWWSLITGKGLILFFYTTEYFARQNNCPPAKTAFLDFILPRSWFCDAIDWQN